MPYEVPSHIFDAAQSEAAGLLNQRHRDYPNLVDHFKRLYRVGRPIRIWDNHETVINFSWIQPKNGPQGEPDFEIRGGDGRIYTIPWDEALKDWVLGRCLAKLLQQKLGQRGDNVVELDDSRYDVSYLD